MSAPYRTEKPIGAPAEAAAKSPVANLASLFPRPHPSAATVRLLSWLALVTGPLAGVPALLLGRVVEREVAAAQGRFVGAPRTTMTLAWAGTYAGSLLALYALASSSTAIAGALIAVGAAASVALMVGAGGRRAPRLLLAWAQLARGAPFLVGVPVAGVLLAGVAGYVSKWSADQHAHLAAAERCVTSTQAAERALSSGELAEARAQLGTARSYCLEPARGTLGSLERGLAEQEATERQRRDDEAAALQIKEAAEQKRRAAEEVAERTRAVEAQLQKAHTLAAQRKWLEADGELRRTDVDLLALRGLAAAPDVVKGFEERASAARGRVAPGLEQARKVRDAREEASRRQTAAREAAEAAQAAARERTETARAAARERAETASESSGRLLCNDGTVSPSCQCAGSHRGCCSHHGGVAGCQ